MPTNTHIRNLPPFRATGKGFINQLPNVPTNSKTASASFTNLGAPIGSDLRTRYLFVGDVETGWTVSGDYGQSAAARTWYPKNLSQDTLIISGVCPNQYEYDRLVEYVLHHHNKAIDKVTTDGFAGTHPLTFKLYGLREPAGQDDHGNVVYRVIHNPMMVDGYVLEIAAGHQRFKFAPAYNLTFKVTNDYLSKPVELEGQLDKKLVQSYLKTFSAGGFYHKRIKGKVLSIKETGGTSGFTDTIDPTQVGFWADRLATGQGTP